MGVRVSLRHNLRSIQKRAQQGGPVITFLSSSSITTYACDNRNKQRTEPAHRTR